jgi:hypothetical protein
MVNLGSYEESVLPRNRQSQEVELPGSGSAPPERNRIH